MASALQKLRGVAGRGAPAASRSSIEATPRSYALLQLTARMALVHAIGLIERDRARGEPVDQIPALQNLLGEGRVIFDKSAADWTIPLRTFKRGAMDKAAPTRGNSAVAAGVGSLKTDQEAPKCSPPST
jgi:hypothetical protein